MYTFPTEGCECLILVSDIRQGAHVAMMALDKHAPCGHFQPSPRPGCIPCPAPGCAKAGATAECASPAGASRESEALWGHHPAAFLHKTLIPPWLGD